MSLAIIVGLYALLSAPPSARLVIEDLQDNSVGQAPDTSKQETPAPPQATAPQTETKPEEKPAIQTETKPEATTPQSQAPSVPAIANPQGEPQTTTKKPAHKNSLPSKNASRKSTRKKPVAKKPPAPKPSDAEPPKVVVHNGSTTDPDVEFSPSVPKPQADAQLQNVNRLLDATDANLKKISGKQLSDTQQDMVKQIRAYMQQAKAAAGESDVHQATNLATKARMLSDELVK